MFRFGQKKILIMRKFYSLFLILLVGISVSSFSQSTLAKIVKNNQIKIGMSGNQPPFSAQAKVGGVIGYEVDLAEMLAVAMGVELEIVQIPFPDLLQALEDGKVDAVMSGMTITIERNLRVAFVGPYVLSGKSILTKSTSVLATATNSQAINEATIKLVTLKGSTSQRFVENNIPDAQLTLINDYDEGVEMVSNDEADAMVADFSICAVSVLRYPERNLTTLNQPLTIEPIGIALPPDDPQLVNLVQNYLNSLQLAGMLERLQKKWFDNGTWLIQLK